MTIDVRIGLHSGVVVVGGNAGEMREQLEIVGETPHIAQRLESIAPHGSIVISDTTLALIEGYFETEPLGQRELKGISRPIAVHRVVRATGAVGRLEAADAAGADAACRPRPRARAADRGMASGGGLGADTIVELTGEAGIGKSRLVHALLDG